MPASYLNLNQNDDLVNVIKKCNTNFKLLATQKQQQQIEESASYDDIGDAISDVVRQINNEASTRSQNDIDLMNAINTEAALRNQAIADAIENVLTYVSVGSINNTGTNYLDDEFDVTNRHDLIVQREERQPLYTPLQFMSSSNLTGYTMPDGDMIYMLNDNGYLYASVPTGNWEFYAR